MSAGHAHRHVRVPHTRVWYVRALRAPLVHVRNRARVEASPYPYGECPYSPRPVACWTLSALGILHRWTGLTLEVTDP